MSPRGCAVLVILHICLNLITFIYTRTLQLLLLLLLYFKLVPLLITIMAQNKRTNLTLDPELDSLITEISQLREVPKTRVITEILEETKPQLEIVRDALRSIKSNESVSLDQVLTKMLGQSFENLGEAFKGFDK